MPKTPGTRDPIARDMRTPKYRKRVAKSDAEKAAVKDGWSRAAKHKKVSLDEFYQVGDKIEIVSGPLKQVLDRAEQIAKKKSEETGKTKVKDKNDLVVIREPNGPANTLGITIDGEYHLVDEEDVKLICEAFDYVDLTEWSYADSTSGIRVPISSEENEVLSKCKTPFYKSNMDEREQEVARRMVSRGVLHRRGDDGGIFFVTDSTKLARF